MGTTFTHIGVVLPDVHAAEAFYVNLFGMDVFCREALTPSGWKTLDPAIDWARARELGLDIAMVVLTRLPIALAIERSKQSEIVAPSHIGLAVPEPAFATLRADVDARGLPSRSDIDGRFIFTDPFHLCWEITDDMTLYTARDRGHGWIDRDGRIHP